MKLDVKVEYSGSDERVDLFVVRVINKDYDTNILTTLERQKHKYCNGVEYIDVWHCDGNRLCATKSYSIEEVITSLFGDDILDDDWYYEG